LNLHSHENLKSNIFCQFTDLCKLYAHLKSDLLVVISCFIASWSFHVVALTRHLILTWTLVLVLSPTFWFCFIDSGLNIGRVIGARSCLLCYNF
jgi:hypothetical protein